MQPCGWTPVFASCEGGGSPYLDSLDPPEREAVIAMAVEFLWRWTDRRFGICRLEVRPCLERCGGQRPSTYWGRGPFVSPDRALALAFACGQCGRDECDCIGGDSFRLPGPVDEVIEVVVDGQTLPAGSYAVVGDTVARTDGGTWPRCQDVTEPLSEPGSWQVTYDRGIEVPYGGRVAAGILADQFARAICGSKDCALPQRVQSVTRQGVTVAVLDSFEDVTQGRTGIWMIDSWVASVTSPALGSSVLSPESLLRRTPRARTPIVRQVPIPDEQSPAPSP